MAAQIPIANASAASSGCGILFRPNNNLTIFDVEIWDNSISTFVPSGQETYTYDTNNNLTSVTTPDYQEFYYYSCSVPTRIKEISNSLHEFEIYPNPSSQEITIELNSKNKMSQITITNYLGEQIIKMDNIENNLQKININNLPAGIYQVSINSNNQILSSKLVITK